MHEKVREEGRMSSEIGGKNLKMRCPSCGNIVSVNALGAYHGDPISCGNCGEKSVVHYEIPRGVITGFVFFATFAAMSSIELNSPLNVLLAAAIVLAGLMVLIAGLRGFASLKKI